MDKRRSVGIPPARFHSAARPPNAGRRLSMGLCIAGGRIVVDPFFAVVWRLCVFLPAGGESMRVNAVRDELSQVVLGLLPSDGVPVLAPAVVIERIRSLREAYRKCIDEAIRAGVVSSQDEVAAYLGIDTAQFNRVLNGGGRHLDDDRLLMLERVCRNKIPSQWLALQDGFELRPIMSELERQVAARDEEIARLRGELDVLVKYGAIRAPREG